MNGQQQGGDSGGSGGGFSGSGGATMLSGLGTILGGVQENQVAHAEATDLGINARESLAAGQRGAEIAQRQSKILQSNQKAAAAAGGSSAGSVNVQTIGADTERIGEYNALTALYRGESVARALRYQANMTNFAGDQAESAAIVKGEEQIATGASTPGPSGSTPFDDGVSLMQKYGGELPPWMQVGA